MIHNHDFHSDQELDEKHDNPSHKPPRSTLEGRQSPFSKDKQRESEQFSQQKTKVATPFFSNDTMANYDTKMRNEIDILNLTISHLHEILREKTERITA